MIITNDMIHIGLKTEIERLTAENRFLFDMIKDDALLVERYNAFNERRVPEQGAPAQGFVAYGPMDDTA